MRTPHPLPGGQSAANRTALAAPYLVFFLLAYLLLGLVGHDPWKADEPYSFGLIHSILSSGDWVVPTLVGEPFMEKPPLYYLAASWVARLLSPPLALHDAARLTSGVFMALTLLFTGLSARAAWGKDAVVAAVLALIGCVGLVGSAHEILTDVALLSGFAIAYYGLSIACARPWAAGLALGTGTGVGFMSKGLLPLGMVGCIAVLLPLCFANWRTRAYLRSLIVAAFALSPWLLVWPWALYQRSPMLFMDWFWLNNLGRYWGFAHLGADPHPWFYTHTLWWFAWPAWPLALWTVWRMRARGLHDASLQLPLLATAVIMGILALSASARALYALPALVPLAALAAGAAAELPGAIAAWLDWASRLFWAACTLLIWAAWLALIAGAPLDLPLLAKLLPSGYEAHLETLPLAVAALLAAAWLAALRRLAHSPLRAVTSWALGITLCWGTLNTLWLPWLDAAKSYRDVYLSLQRALPPGRACIATQGVGESERAMLAYFTGITPLRSAVLPGAACKLLLVQDGAGDGATGPGNGWDLIWQGGRLGDANERHRLFRRRVQDE
jgi:4-amino-4-deoxy-L-arabinose transferase-like glycosyltransferase